MRFGKRATDVTAQTPISDPSGQRDEIIRRARELQTRCERELGDMRPNVEALEKVSQAKLAELRAAQVAYAEASQAYGVLSRSFDNQRSAIDAELRAAHHPTAIDDFLSWIEAEVARIGRESVSYRTVGEVVDGSGRKRAVQQDNYDGRRAFMDQLSAARQAAADLRATALTSEVPDAIKKLRASLDYSLLETYAGPTEAEFAPVGAA